MKTRIFLLLFILACFALVCLYLLGPSVAKLPKFVTEENEEITKVHSKCSLNNFLESIGKKEQLELFVNLFDIEPKGVGFVWEKGNFSKIIFDNEKESYRIIFDRKKNVLCEYFYYGNLNDNDNWLSISKNNKIILMKNKFNNIFHFITIPRNNLPNKFSFKKERLLEIYVNDSFISTIPIYFKDILTGSFKVEISTITGQVVCMKQDFIELPEKYTIVLSKHEAESIAVSYLRWRLFKWNYINLISSKIVEYPNYFWSKNKEEGSTTKSISSVVWKVSVKTQNYDREKVYTFSIDAESGEIVGGSIW